jgi:hypothetical protein
MADSLLHAVLLQSSPATGFREEDWPALELDQVKRRLLISELYEALNRDPVIMPLLVKMILQRPGATPQALLAALADRIGPDYQKVSSQL